MVPQRRLLYCHVVERNLHKMALEKEVKHAVLEFVISEKIYKLEEVLGSDLKKITLATSVTLLFLKLTKGYEMNLRN